MERRWFSQIIKMKKLHPLLSVLFLIYWGCEEEQPEELIDTTPPNNLELYDVDLHYNSFIFTLPIDSPRNVCIICSILRRKKMEKVTKVKKVEITKEAMVRMVEQKLGFKAFELNSLERANKATIALFLKR